MIPAQMSEFQAYVKGSSQKVAYGTSAQQRSAGSNHKASDWLERSYTPIQMRPWEFLKRPAMDESALADCPYDSE